jgi:LmbE family N-acetylglucosaminyl deacetylase
MNVVSIMAHQDDEMRCLGTMLKCRQRGDRLFFVTLTDGSKGFVQNPSIARDEAAGIRDAEMRSLAAAVDAPYFNLHELDESLYDTPELRLRLIDVIRQTQADLIFTHYQEDYNLDHTTTHSLVRQAAMQSCLPVLPSAHPALPRHPAIFLVEPHGPFIFPASHYVDISDWQAEKGRLLLSHHSQEQAMRLATGSGLEEMSRRLDGYRGEQVGCAYAECFVPMRARGALKPFSVLP